MRLIITRHGETIENLNGILQGHNPGSLSDLGIKQAKAVAARLKDEKIDFAYSSDLKRAADTAKAIMKYHPNIPISFVEELRERGLGEMQGKYNDEFDWTDDSEIFNDMNFHPEGGESLGQVHSRAQNFFHMLLKNHMDDTVLVVAHNVIARIFLCIITGKSAESLPKIDKLGNTSITIVEIDEDNSYKINLFNCARHLN